MFGTGRGSFAYTRTVLVRASIVTPLFGRCTSWPVTSTSFTSTRPGVPRSAYKSASVRVAPRPLSHSLGTK